MKTHTFIRSLRRAIVISSAALMTLGTLALTSGCATGPGEKATGAAADVLLPPSDEEKLGQELRRDLLKEVEVYDNDAIQNYVDELGSKAVRAAGNKPKQINYNFTVIKGDDLNAFAMPGGEIYVYTGLLEAMESEAELMGVLSHEVAHVSQRHIAQRLVASYGLQTLLSAALGNNPGVISQLAGSVAAQGYLLKYSRSHESEADRYGIAYMARAGYNPQGFISFFETMQAQSGARMPEFMSSHPNPENRIEEARKIIARMDNVPSETGQQRYQQMMSGLDSSGSTPSRRRSPSTDGDSTDTDSDTDSGSRRRR